MLEIPIAEAYERLTNSYNQRGKGILSKVKNAGELRYDKYFELAMYDKELGYYSSNDADEIIGLKKGFTTDAETKIFGDLMAEHCYRKWVEMGRPNEFDIVEMGGGRGTLALNILNHIKRRSHEDWDEWLSKSYDWEIRGTEIKNDWMNFFNAVTYKIVELSPPFAARQKTTLEPYKEKTEIINASAINFKLQKKIKGVFLSNELVDMFPPRRFVYMNGQWCEMYIASTPYGTLTRTHKPLAGSDPETSDAIEYLKNASSKPREGEHIIFHPGIKEWLANLNGQMEEGSIVTVDYGHLDEHERKLIPTTLRTKAHSQELGKHSADIGWEGLPPELTKILKPKGEEEDLDMALLVPRDITSDIDFGWIGRLAKLMGMSSNKPLSQGDFFNGVLRQLDISMYKDIDARGVIRGMNGEREYDPMSMNERIGPDQLDAEIIFRGRPRFYVSEIKKVGKKTSTQDMPSEPRKDITDFKKTEPARK